MDGKIMEPTDKVSKEDSKSPSRSDCKGLSDPDPVQAFGGLLSKRIA